MRMLWLGTIVACTLNVLSWCLWGNPSSAASKHDAQTVSYFAVSFFTLVQKKTIGQKKAFNGKKTRVAHAGR